MRFAEVPLTAQLLAEACPFFWAGPSKPSWKGSHELYSPPSPLWKLFEAKKEKNELSFTLLAQPSKRNTTQVEAGKALASVCSGPYN